MMRKILAFLVFVSLFAACSKVDDACIELPEILFKPVPNRLSSCSDSKGYTLWKFADGTGKQGTTIEHTFGTTGEQTISQTVYSDDGRKDHTTSVTAYVGYVYIDSIVFTFINTNGALLNGEVVPDLFMRVNGVTSNEQYDDVPDRVVPRTFTFPNGGVYVEQARPFELELYDKNFDTDNLLVFSDSYDAYFGDDKYENPRVYEGDTKYKYKVYWSLGPAQ